MTIVRAARERWGAAAAPWRVLLVGGLFAVLLTVLGAEVLDNVFDGAGVAGLDQPALSWVVEHRTSAWTSFFEAVSTLGNTAVVATVTVVVVAGMLLARQWVSAGQVALAQLGAGALVVAGKAAVGRQRPPEVSRLAAEQTLSFPSGHALGTTVLAVTLVSVVWRCSRRWPYARRRSVRVLSVATAALVTSAVGAARVYLGVHWVTDVLGGWLIGGTWATVCLTVAVLLGIRARALLR